MQTMYPGKVNSPKALTEDIIGASETTIEVSDGSVLPAAPNLAVLGSGENCETILYTVKTGNILSGITRGFQGTAQEWTAETPIGRNFTEYDNAAMQANIAEIAARFIASDSVVYVSKQGSDSNEGTRPFSPKITIGAAMSGLTGGVVRVLDAGTYTEDVTVPNNVMLDAANATIIGAMTVGNGCSVRAAKIMPSANNTTAVTKTGSEISMVDADVWEGRGAAGTLTGTALAYNSVAGAILYATGRTFNVASSGWGVRDNASDNGHIHLNADDMYLFGNDSVGAEVQGPNSHIVIIAQHIITPNGITGTTALKSSNSSARIEATTNEITAAVAALANMGEVAINCPKITGDLTGSGVSVVGRIVGASPNLPIFTGAGGVLTTKTLAEARTALEVVPALLGNVTYYLSPTGNDTIGDGTAGNPWFSINKANSAIPSNLNGYTATINMAAGTYNYSGTNQNITGCNNGTVILDGAYSGTGAAARPATIIQNAILYVRNSNVVGINSIDLRPNAVRGIVCEGSFVKFINIIITGISTTWGLQLNYQTRASFPYDIASRSYNAINDCILGIVVTDGHLTGYYGVVGTGNTTGTSCSSLVQLPASPDGTTKYLTSNGGRIYVGAQTSVPDY